ncbi:MAG: hypothetical protein A2Z25_06565 [Planctomycetes bacterium RBG_16_55_9]|nr:MAG: hypothetical protein A2Z25_06565 [Planctomycetes bacterium RBG_16_55_9]
MFQIRNPKHEIRNKRKGKHEFRNPKQIRNSNAPMTQTLVHQSCWSKSRFEHLNFENSILFRISKFEFRIWKL